MPTPKPTPTPSQDIVEFIGLCLSRKVEFVIVGGWALSAHGAPRFTEDIDFLLRISPENADKMEEVLAEFGFAQSDIRREDFLQPGQVIQFGRKPNRIDLLLSIDGVTWEEAWESRTQVRLGPHVCWAIGVDALIRNKRASGRPQDIADVFRLEQGQAKRPKD
jgi:hypothetical protein